MDSVGYQATVATDLLPSEVQKWNGKEYVAPQEYSNSATFTAVDRTAGTYAASPVARPTRSPSTCLTQLSASKAPRTTLHAPSSGATDTGRAVAESVPAACCTNSPTSSLPPENGRHGNGTVKGLGTWFYPPQGVEFDRIWDVRFNNYTQSQDSYTAAGLPNYLGDGRDALIISLAERMVKYANEPDAKLAIRYYLRATEAAPVGVNTIEAFHHLARNGEREVQAEAGNQRYVDALDLDKDGDSRRPSLRTATASPLKS